MQYILAQTKEDISVDSLKEYRDFTIDLIQQARHSIDIFTQNMEAEIYNNKEIETSIFSLAKRHPNTCIRILVQDSKRATQNGHCLIRLAQSLTSSVFINKPSHKHKDVQSYFLIIDRVAILQRISANHNNYNANINYMAPKLAKELGEKFTELWEHSSPDTQTRRLHM